MLPWLSWICFLAFHYCRRFLIYRFTGLCKRTCSKNRPNLLPAALSGQQFPLWLSRKAAPLSADNFLLSADFLPQGFREKGADNSHALRMKLRQPVKVVSSHVGQSRNCCCRGAIFHCARTFSGGQNLTPGKKHDNPFFTTPGYSASRLQSLANKRAQLK